MYRISVCLVAFLVVALTGGAASARASDFSLRIGCRTPPIHLVEQVPLRDVLPHAP
jgi:hypothetical protein